MIIRRFKCITTKRIHIYNSTAARENVDDYNIIIYLYLFIDDNGRDSNDSTGDDYDNLYRGKTH